MLNFMKQTRLSIKQKMIQAYLNFSCIFQTQLTNSSKQFFRKCFSIGNQYLYHFPFTMILHSDWPYISVNLLINSSFIWNLYKAWICFALYAQFLYRFEINIKFKNALVTFCYSSYAVFLTWFVFVN